VQALGQSNTLKLFYSSDAAAMAIHIAINNGKEMMICIWEGLIIAELIYHPT
jgi:hypothetical protein